MNRMQRLAATLLRSQVQEKVKGNDDVQDLVNSSVVNIMCTVEEEKRHLLHNQALILIQQAIVYIW